MPAPPASANGFKSPAPVLPAMGLHSFHNDSPPFAAAPISDHPSPEHFILDPNRPRSSGLSQSQSSSSEIIDLSHPVSGSASSSSSMPMPIPTRNTPSNLLAKSTETPGSSPQRPTATNADSQTTPRSRIPSSEDEHLSSSRSRRLVSGYLFGNPPSPVGGSRPIKPSTSHADGDSGPPTPLRTDSPPLSEPPNDRTWKDGSAPGTTKASAHFETLALEDGPTPAEPSLARRKSRRDSKVDKETGYDVFSGMQDGEADLDESAPQAEGSTEAYMHGVGGEAGEYKFPQHRLRTRMKDEGKIPLVIVACGSFSPPTYLHLRMFEMAKDEIIESQTYEIMGGYYSPVSSQYKKSGLAPAIDRVRMCELAVEHTSTWLMVDPWEAGQAEYQRTAVVLDHFDEMLNVKGGGILTKEGKRRKYKIMLLAGGDLIESFGEPGVWSEPDLHIILGRFGCLIVERAGSDVWAFLLSHDILYHHRRNVIVIKQLIYNDISSTKVRLFVRRGMSIKYLLPNSVIQYIYDHKLYRESDHKAIAH